MREGRSIVEIAKELQRQVAERKDFLADTDALEMVIDSADGKVKMAGLDKREGRAVEVNDLAHSQIAEDLKIPKPYYDRLLVEDPELLIENVNRPFVRKPMKRLVRTLDGRARAFLSNRYRPLDNFNLMEVALPTLHDRKAKIVSAELTERRMYVKAIFPDLSDPIPGGLEPGVGHSPMSGRWGEGNFFVAAIIISNSEVGYGSIAIEAGGFETWCTNLVIAKDVSMRKYHLGRAQEVDGIRELLSDEAKVADDRALWLKFRDVVRNAADPANFKRQVEKIHEANDVKITGVKIPEVVEVITKTYGLSDEIGGGILEHLINGGNLSQWGLVRAVTRASADVENYDTATDMERTGGKILALPPAEFQSLVKQAA